MDINKESHAHLRSRKPVVPLRMGDAERSTLMAS